MSLSHAQPTPLSHVQRRSHRLFPRKPAAYLFLSFPRVSSHPPILHISLSLLLYIPSISMDEIHPSWLWEDSQPVEHSESMHESLLAEDSLLDVDDSELAYGGVLPTGGALTSSGVLSLAEGSALADGVMLLLADGDAVMEGSVSADSGLLPLADGDAVMEGSAPTDGDAVVEGGAFAECSMHLKDGGVHALEHVVHALVDKVNKLTDKVQQLTELLHTLTVRGMKVDGANLEDEDGQHALVDDSGSYDGQKCGEMVDGDPLPPIEQFSVPPGAEEVRLELMSICYRDILTKDELKEILK
ncbi:hypothetical protein D1007_23426 [Hordeum vulgare]|nr:hypothetical protein D1007_56859 [Hordeum vulgare]KAE8800928.1 hypothetical protein D1007_23426 [Hordeum vulgare]